MGMEMTSKAANVSINAKSTARPGESQRPAIDGFRGQHMALAERQIATEHGRAQVTVDDSESPLAWLARRRGRNGRALIEPHQFQACERLRADFTRAHMMPRTTSNWASPIAAGPEFGGLLLDVCCFLKGLEDIERERAWPSRSAKVVLQLALDRLARHYGYAPQVTGRAQAAIRTWLAEGESFRVEYSCLL